MCGEVVGIFAVGSVAQCDGLGYVAEGVATADVAIRFRADEEVPIIDTAHGDFRQERGIVEFAVADAVADVEGVVEIGVARDVIDEG